MAELKENVYFSIPKLKTKTPVMHNPTPISRLFIGSFLAAGLFLVAVLFLSQPNSQPEKKKQSGAGLALDAWAYARAFPGKEIPMRSYSAGFEAHTRMQQANTRNSTMSPWEPMGPKNIGGRTLCLAFNPLNSNTIYAGSASGGLWRTRTEGVGVTAWEQVDLGHPVLGVGAIAITPGDSMVMYVGTGEVYNYGNTAPGVANRITRGTYGIGVLKSVDGGDSWVKSLDWSYGDMRGVSDLLINPLNPNTVFAATSEGLYRSRDAGASWQLVLPLLMAIDIEMHVSDTNRVYVSMGNFGTTGNGLYRSEDGGNSFSKLSNGLPASYTGKALISISESQPNILYASIADDFVSIGLYRSDDGGDSWNQVNIRDVAKYQGWYSHDVVIHPQHPDTLIYVGIDAWKSTNGGQALSQKAYWYNWYFGQTPVGGPEGPPDYVHADIHAGYFHPTDPNKVFLATDGGVFVSTDIGENWEGRNGSYQATQFYANFSNSTTDSSLAIGGMQDNATAVYFGDDSWHRVIGGDGLSAAINPVNDLIIYGSYQYLGMRKSTDGGLSFFQDVFPPEASGENTSFAGPYELAPSNPELIYAGRERIYRSDDGAQSWVPASNPLDTGNPILTIAVSATNPNLLYASTVPLASGQAKVFKCEDGGVNWVDVSLNLPNRFPTDIAIHPQDDEQVYVTFSGFGTSHLYFSDDGGATWTISDAGIPDVPANTICIDPLIPSNIYLGNDLGVYVSTDAGLTWETFCLGLPEAVLVMHLSVSPSNRKLRVATHGNGVYQTPLLDAPLTSIKDELPNGVEIGQNYPNPAVDRTTIPIQLDRPMQVKISLLDVQGRFLKTILKSQVLTGEQAIQVDLNDLSSGTYLYRWEMVEQGAGKSYMGVKRLVRVN